MKITKNADKFFILPTWLMVNVFTVGIIRKKLKKEGVELTRKQTSKFIKEIRRYKKNHSDWNLVEIDSKNGDTMNIKI